MARPEDFPILAQLRSARTLPDRIAALRALKNEIVGHGQLKEAWIGLGVLEPIVRTIGSSSRQSWANGKDVRVPGYRPLSDEDGAKLQALQLVASLANGIIVLEPQVHLGKSSLTLLPRRTCFPRSHARCRHCTGNPIRHLSG